MITQLTDPQRFGGDPADGMPTSGRFAALKESEGLRATFRDLR